MGVRLTQKLAKELFDYKDGVLIWKVYANSRAKTGDIAGHQGPDKYCRIRINGGRHLRSRLIWLWHHGYFPENEIDHIDRNPLNDRIENLREVSRQCNARNCGNRKDNTSGVKGIYYDTQREKWIARIMILGKTYNLGGYARFYNAVLARLAAEQCLNWEGCDSSSPSYQYAAKNGLLLP